MRRLKMTCRAPKATETIERFLCELHGDEKVRLIVVRTTEENPRIQHEMVKRVIRACETARIHIGACVMAMPPGAEFEVWEEP